LVWGVIIDVFCYQSIKEDEMSNDYDFRNDGNLKYRIALNSVKGYVHRSHEANFFWYTDKGKQPNDTEIFLLMPAEKNDGVVWYYIFIADAEVDPCLTIGSKTNEKLGTDSFNGGSNQQFSFEDTGDNKVYIKSKGSGLYLYRGALMDAHYAVRQASKKDSDDYKFQIERLSQVIMPATANPESHPKPGNIGDPPYPEKYGDIPNTKTVFVGETLIPFYMVGSDSACVGNNLRSWQINNRPYYCLKREQQWRLDPKGIINQPDIAHRTEKIKVSSGIEQQSGTVMQKKTGFSVGMDFGNKSEMGVTFDGITAKTETTRAFKIQWQNEVTITTTESTKIWETTERELIIDYETVSGGFTYIYWVLTDIWTLLSGEDTSDSWEVMTVLSQPTTFPKSAKVTTTLVG